MSVQKNYVHKNYKIRNTIELSLKFKGFCSPFWTLLFPKHYNTAQNYAQYQLKSTIIFIHFNKDQVVILNVTNYQS